MNQSIQFIAWPAFSLVILCLLAGDSISFAAGPEDSQATPARTAIDFDHDIRPIFESSCLRCHGPERPRSRFRLDNRDSALKGGDDGVDIVPGRSDKSPLLERVASSDEDKQMPPPGKGARLTTAQIEKLRAWIDQGANWSGTNAVTPFHFDAEPQFVWIGVHGDKGKFREIEGTNNGFSGGLRNFSIEEQISPDERLSLDGHVLSAGQDSALHLNITRNDAGFIHAGFEEWRHYSDNIGGYDPALKPPDLPSAGSLELDEGRAWIDLGLTLPQGPRVVLGYEEQFRVGSESELDWGGVSGNRIAPSTNTVNKHTDIIKLDISGDLAGWQWHDRARVEIHREQSQDDESSGPGASFHTRDHYDDAQGMNTLNAEKALRDWWLVSLGYFYSLLESSDSLSQSGSPVVIHRYWQAPQVTLSTESQILSASSLFRPAPPLSLGLDAQFQWSREEGAGQIANALGTPALPILTPAVMENANFDEFKSMQNAEMRFTKIPWTVLFAAARFEQDGNTMFENGVTDGADQFDFKTAAQNTEYDARSGFTASPRNWISLTTQYEYDSSHTAYNNLTNLTPGAYPAFIQQRTIKTDNVDTKLVLRPANWLRTTFNYKIEGTDFSTGTALAPGVSPGGPLVAGKYEAYTYGFSSSLTPVPRVNLTGSLSYSDSRLWTFANDDPSVVPYQGGIYMLDTGAAYAINPKADLSAGYSYAHAEYGQNNGAAAVPSGVDYTRHTVTIALSEHFSARVSAAVRYSFYTYSEPTAGGLTDYTAQGIFATLTFRW
jgi:mono/diheme cytochrome c family protein